MLWWKLVHGDLFGENRAGRWDANQPPRSPQTPYLPGGTTEARSRLCVCQGFGCEEGCPGPVLKEQGRKDTGGGKWDVKISPKKN